MKYDLLTGKRDGAPKEVSSLEFWRTFLTLLNARATFDSWIHPKEIKVMSWILSQDNDRCYFSKPHSNEIMDSVDNLSMPELTRIKKRLIAAGLVEEVASHGKIRTHPSKMLIALRSALMKSGQMELSFYMKISPT